MKKFLITLFGGPFGIHKFAEGKMGMGFLYLFTCGLFGIGWMIDVILCVINISPHSASLRSINIFPQKSATPPIPAPSVFAQAHYITVNDYDQMEGHDFEYFCAQILRENLFENVEVTKGSGDQGIDIIAYKDGIKYGIQCKCYASDIGNKAVQEAFAGKTYYGCHVAAVLTNRYFTKSAKELAEKNGVLLWDRDKLEFFRNNTLN